MSDIPAQAAAAPAMNTAAPITGYGSKSYRSYVLGTLLLVYIFNFIDRSIINILTEPIKLSFGVEDWQMGLLGGPVFAILYTVLGIPIARLAERFNRIWIITVSVILWSLMTALCGIAPTFLMLVLFRLCVGIGEAGCTPPAQSVIADYFMPKSRATAVSIYALGVPLGGMMAAVFAGFIMGALDGEHIRGWLLGLGLTGLANAYDWPAVESWRIAFVLVGLPGVVLGIIFRLTVKEPPRGYTDPARLQAQPRVGFVTAFMVLMRKPTFVHMVIGATIASFVGYGVSQFTTSFLVRTHGLTIPQAAILFGVVLGLMAAVGVFLSGYLSDKFARRHPNALSWLPALGMSVSVPFYAVGYLADSLYLALPVLMVAACLHYFYLGPMYAIAGGVADSRMRATAVALTLFVVNLVGYGLGPPLIGILSTFLKTIFLSGAGLGLTLDLCKASVDLSPSEALACVSADARGLQWSIIVFITLYAWAALHYLIAGKTLRMDMVARQDD